MEQKSNISFVNLSTYNSPVISEDSRNEWVEFGEDNNYFQYLIDRLNGSATNGAVVTSISQMIYGRGLSATDSARRPEQYAQMISLFKSEDVKRLAYDLKFSGQCAIQVIYSSNKTKIEKVEHLPIETIRAEKLKGDDKKVQAYYYYPKWEDITPSDKPERIPAFGISKVPAKVEILFVKPYKAGMYYYSTPDYQGGLQYAELEEEISNYHINNVQNGLAPSMLINMNNGTPDEKQQRLIESKIRRKFSGSSNAGKFILAFNDSKEAESTITPVPLSDASEQYQFLSEESQRKILVSHRVVSPMLFGIKDNTGFGNNAEELKDSVVLQENMVIQPFRDMLIDAFDQILAFNNISLNLYFRTLQPLQFVDLENVKDKETEEEETGVKLSKMLEDFGEEENLDEWELIDERKVDYELEDDLDAEIDNLNNPKKSILSKIWEFAKTGVARPNAKSEQDGSAGEYKYKVRYQYAPLSAHENSREFCKKMVNAKKIYRKEDIQRMGKSSVNAGWGLKGADNYDIWLYKGGGGCHHYWMRKTYRAKGINPDAKNPNAEVSVNQAKKSGFKPTVNDKKVAMKPKDMPNQGFVNK